MDKEGYPWRHDINAQIEQLCAGLKEEKQAREESIRELTLKLETLSAITHESTGKIENSLRVLAFQYKAVMWIGGFFMAMTTVVLIFMALS